MFDQVLSSNPFQILTLIVAPAILTNSSSVLSLSTSNRFARAVDRSRGLYEKLKHPEHLEPTEKALYAQQLEIIGRRSILLVNALTWFYVSVGSFAATAFISLLGAGFSFFHSALGADIAVLCALVSGTLAVTGLVCGSGLLVREMWLALSFLKAEVKLTESILSDS